MTISDHKKRGFTLTELLVVLAIMAVIASLIVIAAKGARKKADYEAAKAGVQFISSQIDAYKNKRGELPPNLNPPANPASPDVTFEDLVTTEKEIYYSLSQWGFTVPVEKQIDPWGHPYVIVLQRDYVPTEQKFNMLAPFDRTDAAGSHYPYGPDYAPTSSFADPAERDSIRKYLSDKVSTLSDVYKLTALTVPQSLDANHWGKAIHKTNPRGEFYNSQSDGYQVFSAGPDGKAFCDFNQTDPNWETYQDLNEDNVSNWTD